MAQLCCIKCKHDMALVEEDAFSCRKCANIAYTTGYIRNKKPLPTDIPKATRKKPEKINTMIAIYCEDCAAKGILTHIGYAIEGQHPNNRKRFCDDCKIVRARNAQAKFYKIHGKKKRNRKKKTEKIATV